MGFCVVVPGFMVQGLGFYQTPPPPPVSFYMCEASLRCSYTVVIVQGSEATRCGFLKHTHTHTLACSPLLLGLRVFRHFWCLHTVKYTTKRAVGGPGVPRRGP